MFQQRRLRISLRAAMALVLITAVWLALQVDEARHQREAVAAVKRQGGAVIYAHQFVNGKYIRGKPPSAPAWLRRAAGDECFQEVTYVCLEYDPSPGGRFDKDKVTFCDDALSRLARLNRVRSMDVSSPHPSNEGLRHIGSLTGLEELSLQNSHRLTDHGFVHLTKIMYLHKLYIRDTSLTDDALRHLASLPRLEELWLLDNRITDRGLAYLRGMTGLKKLVVFDSARERCGITDKGMAHLSGLANLEELDIRRAKISERGLVHLRALTKLKQLWVCGTSITPEAFERLRIAMPNLKELKR